MDQRLRLRRIVRFADFRKSEMTNWEEFARKRGNRDLVQSLGPLDCVMFTSTGEDQLVFISGFRQLKDTDGGEATDLEILASRRLRLRSGRWNPRRLTKYGEEAGIKIDGPGFGDYRQQYEKQHYVLPRSERKPERPSAKEQPISAVLHHH